MVTADDGSLADSAGPDFVNTDLSDLPRVVASPISIPCGSGPQMATVVASKFGFLEPYEILFNDSLVTVGTTDSSGELSETIAIPAMPDGVYVVDVITDSGGVGIDVIQVGPGAAAVPAVGIFGLLALGSVALASGALVLRRRERAKNQ